MLRQPRRAGRTATVLALVPLGVMPILGPAAGATSTGSVVALWHLDEQPGASIAVDSSGFHHDGAIGNVPLGVSSYDASTAYLFTGQGLVRVPHAADLNPGAQPLTVSAYLLVPADLKTGDYNVVQKGTATTTGGAYKLEIYAATTSRVFGYPDCALNSPSGHNRVYGPFKIADGKWHHVVCNLTLTQAWVTVDDQPGPKAARLVGTIANTTEVTIGGKPTNTHYYVGRADEVTITIG